MIQFEDASGNKWSFRGVSSRVERIRDESGFDFGLLHDEEGIKRLQAACEDREQFLKIVRAAVEEQPAAQQMTQDAWDEAWPTDLIIPTMVLLGKEAARFFTPLRSTAVISALDRLTTAYQQVMEQVRATISSVDLPLIDAATLAESSGSTPAS